MCLIPDDFTTKFDTRLSIYSVQVIKSKPLFFHSYSIAWFKSEDAVRQAEHDLDGKYVNGCILLVKPFTGRVPVLKEAKPVDIAREEKLPGVSHMRYRMSWGAGEAAPFAQIVQGQEVALYKNCILKPTCY